MSTESLGFMPAYLIISRFGEAVDLILRKEVPMAIKVVPTILQQVISCVNFLMREELILYKADTPIKHGFISVWANYILTTLKPSTKPKVLLPMYINMWRQ